MKRPAIAAALVPVVALFGLLVLDAQDDKKKPQTWEEKAAARFGDNPTADHKAEIDAAIPEPAREPKADRKALVFYRCEGFIHTSIPFGNYALEAIAKKTGAFSVDLADDYSVFTEENLAGYDVIIFNNTTNLVPNDAQRAAILGFIEGGKGIAGLHAAADNFKQWEEGIALIGGVFAGHPWTAGGTWAFKLDDPGHPLTAAFGGKGFWHKDEIYWYKSDNFQGRENLRVLLSLDMAQKHNRDVLNHERWKGKYEGAAADLDVPVSWLRTWGEGRLFYTNLGHNDMTFANPTVLQHILDGIQYAAGDLEADATPTAELELRPALAPDQGS